MKGSLSDITICIPTCNRAEMVEEVLEYNSTYYEEYDLKVIYYDSSNDNRTEQIIKKYIDRGYGYITYVRTSSDQSIDDKLYNVLRYDKDIRERKYLWLINDSISIQRECLDEISEYIKSRYDLIRLQASGSGVKEDIICTDPNDWFYRCSKGMAHMASTIMSVDLLDRDTDWEGIYNRYVCDKDGNKEYFFTIGLYLEQILKKDNFVGVMPGKRTQWRRDSPLKKEKSYWNDIVFEVWARSYCDTIFKLPKCYTEKEHVIRISDNIVFGRFEKYGLIGFRRKGLLNTDVVQRYKNYWKYVSTLSYDEIMEIASFSEGQLKRLVSYNGEYEITDDWEKNLDNIEKMIGELQIIVYGAGIFGEYVIDKLVRDGYREQIIGVAVSDASLNVNEIKSFGVKCIDEYVKVKSEDAVIIATRSDNALEIEKNLKEKGFKIIMRIL